MTDDELIKAAGSAIDLNLYEHRGQFYKHYVDDRDACGNWNPLKHPEDATELLFKKRLSMTWSKVNDEECVTVGDVTNVFTEDNKMKVVLRTITEAAIKSIN